MLQRTLPAGFIAPCLPTKTDKLPSGSQWLHEIKHDGFRLMALFAALVILSGCTREEATASLKADLQVDHFEIIHARFPCWSPDMHFFGYRFRIRVKNEYAHGDICWDLSARQWTWRILPGYPLSHLNIRK
jgi:hypothetical protein